MGPRVAPGTATLSAVMFSFSDNQMGGYGDARARELTLAIGRVVGA